MFASMMRMSSGCSVRATEAPIICAIMPGTPLEGPHNRATRTRRRHTRPHNHQIPMHV
jgi:hypothetical protein